MADDGDPWENTKALLGDDFFDPPERTDEEVRAAFESELQASNDEGRPFSALAFLASLRGSGLEQLAPGVYYGRGERAEDDGHGGWISGAC